MLVYGGWRRILESMCLPSIPMKYGSRLAGGVGKYVSPRYPRGIWWSMGLGRGVWDLAGDVGKYVAQTIFKSIVIYGGWRGCWKVCASYYIQGI